MSDRLGSAAELRRLFKPIAVTVKMTAAADPSATLVTARTGFTPYIQRIAVTVTTDAAQTLTFRDTAGTPVVIAVLKASAGIERHPLLEADEGVPLTADKGLDLAASAAGYAGVVVVEGYWKQTSVLTVAEAAAR